MHALSTVILEHTTADGAHHDWLIEDPRLPNPQAPDARLWTARVLAPPSQWTQLARFDLEVIAPHRRAYLTYEGPVSGDRGRVRRVAKGWCEVHQWSEGRIVMTLRLNETPLDLQLTHQAQNHWSASMLAGPLAGPSEHA